MAISLGRKLADFAAKLSIPIPISLGGTGATSMGAGAVGAVSQAAGVATGAVVQRGFTAGVGDWVKFADGTLICTSGGVSLVTGSIAGSNIGTVVNLVLAQPFVGICAVSVQVTPSSTSDHFGVTDSYLYNATTAQAVIRNGATAQTFSLRYIAIGRWY